MSAPEPEGEGEPEPESTVTPGNTGVLPEGTVAPELPEPEATDCLPEAEAFGSPSHTEIIAPPVILTACILFVLMILSMKTQPKRWKYILSRTFLKPSTHKLPKCSKHALKGSTLSSNVDPDIIDSFLTETDHDVITSFKMYQNAPLPLFGLALPACISLIFCPLTLYLHQPLVDALWPPELFPDGPPNVNDVIACFLAPTGLVYAIAFGFAFQEAMEKKEKLANRFADRLNKMRQIQFIFRHLSQTAVIEKEQILKILKQETIDWMDEIVDENGSLTDYKDHSRLFELIEVMRGIKSRGDETDQSLCDNLLQLLVDLHDLSVDSLGVYQTTMSTAQWIFLELLGTLTYFGILLVRAQSFRLELTMCMMTVFTISMFCYMLADLAQPYHGLFKVNIHVLVSFLNHVSEDFRCLQHRHSVKSVYRA